MAGTPSKIPKMVNLALQGGGSHGAFTWGVLDYLLEDNSIDIEALSGTSAGAMNGAVLIYGLMEGGREGARRALANFWKKVSNANWFNHYFQDPIGAMTKAWTGDYSHAYTFFDVFSRLVSPYQFNPLDFNPLRSVLRECIDFTKMRACTQIKLYVTATNVRTGKPRVFTCEEITEDALLASACLPFLFKAVEIEGEYYWDGGYMGNPAIWPFFYRSQSSDVVIVQLNPIQRPDLPTTAGDIIDRLNEITFNASLISQMRSVDFVSRLVKEGKLSKDRYKDVHVHLIEGDQQMLALDATSKLSTDWDMMLRLKDIGRQVAETWLKKSYNSLGERSSVDIAEIYL